METNNRLKESLLEVVNNQLRSNDPPETRQTFDRLIDEGYSEKEAKELIGHMVTSEIFDVLKNLPKSLEWRSFYLNDLPLLMDFCKEVREGRKKRPGAF